MKDDLFREEAVEAQTASRFGHVRVFSPVSHDVWTAAAVCVVGLLVSWLFLGHYQRRVHVSGVLVPTAGVLTVAAPTAGVIVMKNFNDGASVKKGDVLLVISGERISGAIGSVPGAIANQIHEDDQRIVADSVAIYQLEKVSGDDLRNQQRSLRLRLQSLDEEATTIKQQVDSIAALLKRIEPLEKKGYASSLDIQQQRTQEFEAETQLKNVDVQREEVAQQLKSVGAQLDQLPLTTSAKLSELHRQHTQNEQNFAQVEGDRSLSLIAPCDGSITSLMVKNGQSVAVGAHLLAILPKGSNLQADLYVPSEAIGFIRAGARVALHYQAFPYQKFGVHDGSVSTVGSNAFTPTELTTLLGKQPPQESYYQVEVALARQSVVAYGSDEALRPGMALDADVMLDRRRMIEWVLEPLYGMGRRYSQQ